MTATPRIQVRRSDERGHADHGWLDSHHTFSFADYYDPRFMGFGVLRVINEDRVTPGAGFPTHGHRDMEIVSYVLDGALAHKDSMGNGSTLRPGDVQRMSAGTGVRHSEFNASPDAPLHFFQIWILPEKTGLPPSYEEKHFSDEDRRNRLRLVASPDGSEGSIRLHQDVRIRAALLDAGQTIEQPIADGRRAWVQLAHGGLTLATDGAPSVTLAPGDGAAVLAPSLRLSATAPSELLFFDLP